MSRQYVRWWNRMCAKQEARWKKLCELNLTGQSYVAMPSVGGIRSTSAASGNNLPAPTWIMRLDGVAQNGITAFKTWAALLAVANLATANTIVETQNVTPGVAEQWTGSYGAFNSVFDVTGLNVTPSTPFILRGRVGDIFRFTSSNVIFNAVNASGFIVDFSKCHAKWGRSDIDYSLTNNNVSNGLPNSDPNYGFYISNSTRFAIIGEGWSQGSGANYLGVTGASQIYGGRQYTSGIYIDSGCNNYVLQDLDVFLAGNNGGGSANGKDQTGNLAGICGGFNYILRCRFRLGGHDAFESDCYSSIFDSCEFGQYWVPYHTGAIGSRATEMAPARRSHGAGAVDGKGPGPPYGGNFYYNCVFRDCAAAVDGKPSMFSDFASYGDTFLGCWFLDNLNCGIAQTDLPGVSMPSQSGSTLPAVGQLNFLHCTALNLFVPLFRFSDLPDTADGNNGGGPLIFEQERVLNCMFLNVQGPAQSPLTNLCGVWMWQLLTTGNAKSGGGTWRNGLKGSEFRNNIIALGAGIKTLAAGGTDDCIMDYASGDASKYTFDNPPGSVSSIDPNSGQPNVAGNVRATLNQSGANNVNLSVMDTSPGRLTAGLTLAAGTTVGLADAPPITYSQTGSSGATASCINAWWLQVANIAVADPQGFAPLAARANYQPMIRTGANLAAAQAAANSTVTATNCVPGALTSTVTFAAPRTVAANDGWWFAGLTGVPSSQRLWQNRGAA